MTTHRVPSGRGARLRRALALAALLAAAPGITGCDSDPVAPEPVAWVEISSPATSLVAGDSLVLVVTLRSASGRPLAGRAVTWSSSDTTVALVRATGRLVARSAGSATITAAAGGRSASLGVTVEALPTAPVLHALSPSQLYAGENGATLTLHGSGFTERSVALWNGQVRGSAFVSDQELQVFVSPVDLATAGTATVEVVTPPPGGGRSTVLTFTIMERPVPTGIRMVLVPSPVVVLTGQRLQMIALYVDSAGRTVAGPAEVQYRSDDPWVAESTVGGYVTGVRPGLTRLFASAPGGYSASAEVEVRPAPIGSSVMYQSEVYGPHGQVVDTVMWDMGAGPAKAHLVVRIARITLHMVERRYVQEFQAHVLVDGLVVGNTGWFERGAAHRNDANPVQIVFTPDGGGAGFTAMDGGLGDLRVHQRVRRAATPDSFLYIVREATPQ